MQPEIQSIPDRPLHRREELSPRARAFNFGADSQAGEGRSAASSPQIEIPICKHPGIRRTA